MIICISGTHGAGKGTVVEYLVEKKGFVHLSARTLIMEEVKRRGLAPTRVNISNTVTDMRSTISPLWVVETLYERARQNGNKNVVIESIYTLDELHFLKDQGAICIAVDADLELRFERITERGSETDHVTFEEFKAVQKKELESDNPQSQNAALVMKHADFVVENNGSLEELHTTIESVLKNIESKM